MHETHRVGLVKDDRAYRGPEAARPANLSERVDVLEKALAHKSQEHGAMLAHFQQCIERLSIESGIALPASPPTDKDLPF